MNAVLLLLKKKSTLFFLLLVAGMLVVGGIFRLLTPSLPPTTNSLTEQGNAGGGKTDFSRIVFQGDQPALPQTLWLAEVTSLEKPDLKPILDSIIRVYNLAESPYSDSAWSSDSYSLEYYQDTNEIILVRQLLGERTPVLVSQGSVGQLLRSAERIVHEALPETRFSSMPSLVRYLSGTVQLEPADPQTATMIQVPFSLQFNGLPVIYGFERDFPVLVTLTADGELVKMNIRPFSVQFTATNQKPVVSAAEAVSAINAGNASIIDSYSELTVVPSLDKIRRGTLRHTQVEYRVDSTHKTLIPYYRFSGEFVNDQDDLFTAEVITPAVRLD